MPIPYVASSTVDFLIHMGEQDLDPLKEPQAMKQIHHKNQMCGGFLIGKIQRLALLDSAANPWEETHGTRLAFASSTVATLKQLSIMAQYIYSKSSNVTNHCKARKWNLKHAKTS